MPKQKNHWSDVAIDCETLSTRPNAAVIAVGACAFDRETGALHADPFYQVIKLDSAMRAGHVSGDTVAWWVRQGDDARGLFSEETQGIGSDLYSVLARFNDWWRCIGHDLHPWGNGATADITWMESAYATSVGITAPWQAQFWKIRDQRTLLDVAWEVAKFEKPAFKGTTHNARDDAIHQATTIAAAFKAIRKAVVTTKPPIDDEEL